MGLDQAALILAGALAAGIVNGLTGFGTGLTAMGIWLYAIAPTTASSLVLICSVVAQLQTVRLVWHTVRWGEILPYLIPGVIGVPLGTLLLPQIEPRYFKLGVGIFLVIYPAYVLLRRTPISIPWGGKIADAVMGFGGGVLGGLAGFSGVLPIVWTDIRGMTKEQRRGVVQGFNLSILTLSLLSHAALGLLTRQVWLVAIIALPGTIAGAWIGTLIYRRLADRGYQRAVMALLLLAGIGLIVNSW